MSEYLSEGGGSASAGSSPAAAAQVAAPRKGPLAAYAFVAVCSLFGLVTNVMLTQLGDRAATAAAAAAADGSEWAPLSVRKLTEERVVHFFDEVVPSLDGYVPQMPAAFIKLAYDGAANGGDCSPTQSPASGAHAAAAQAAGSAAFSTSRGRLRVQRAGYYYVYAKADAGLVQKDAEGIKAAIVVSPAGEDGDEQNLTEATLTLPIGSAACREGSIFSARVAELAIGDEVHLALRCVKRQSDRHRCAPEACASAFLGMQLLADSRPAAAAASAVDSQAERQLAERSVASPRGVLPGGAAGER